MAGDAGRRRGGGARGLKESRPSGGHEVLQQVVQVAGAPFRRPEGVRPGVQQTGGADELLKVATALLASSNVAGTGLDKRLS